MTRRLRRSQEPHKTLHPIKLRAIDAAFQRKRVRSFADLGGIWAVDGGYTFYALEQYSPSRAILVDEEFTPTVVARAKAFPSLTAVSNNFGNKQVVATLRQVDVILLFDVLLHQVKPDWNDILQMYAPVTDCFIIVNPQYIRGTRTVRLIDLGAERYFESTPPQPGYEDLFERLDEYLPERGRHYRDIHNLWQWGIVDSDLRELMEQLQFELVYFENAGQWRDQPAFENHAFVFVRKPLSE